MDPCGDDVLNLLSGAAEQFVSGDVAAGKRVLEPVSGVTIADEPLVLLDALPAGAYVPAAGPLTQAPPLQVQAVAFARDRYVCVYCGRRTVFLQVLNLLARAFPEELPRHPNWKRAETHRLYWDLTTTIDHVHPVSRGGSVDAVENLATACSRCQYQKGNRPVESLGWRPHRTSAEWDGLTELYRPLWEALGRPAGVHRRWLAAFAAAGHVGAQRQHSSGPEPSRD